MLWLGGSGTSEEIAGGGALEIKGSWPIGFCSLAGATGAFVGIRGESVLCTPSLALTY